MVSAAVVIHRILDELEARNAHFVKGQVIGAASVLSSNGGHSEVFQGCNPLRENRPFGEILLQVNAANPARAIVYIEVTRDQLLLRFELDGPARFAQKLRLLQLFRDR